VTGPSARVSDLRIEITASGADVVDAVSLQLYPGEVLGLVGESGSGKTTVGTALLGYVRRGGRVAGGDVTIDGCELRGLSRAGLRRIRGAAVSYIPQDPGTSLNPALRIGTQLTQVLEAHDVLPDAAARRRRVREVLEEVALASDDAFLARFPHQLSGGQQQRVVIAMAFANRPAVIVCDEPTTGLDVTTQARVLATIRDLCEAHRVAALYISHDLSVVAGLADRVAVMYAGRVVEHARRREIFDAPRHPYTRRLLSAVPEVDRRRDVVGIPGRASAPGYRPRGCTFHPRCDLASPECLEAFPPRTELGDGHEVWCFHHAHVRGEASVPTDRTGPRQEAGGAILELGGVSASYGDRQVVHDVSFAIAQNECLAVVGESGSGKTTLARCIAGLHTQYTGDIRLDGAQLEPSARDRSDRQRRTVQYIFQNPYASLDPRRTVGQTLVRRLRLLTGLKGDERAARIRTLLERVSLTLAVVDRFPGQLSGGERQRVAIARALAAEPLLLVCDEITSALDVSVQAAILELLEALRAESGLSLLFITHNLAVVRQIADRAIVMTDGRIVDAGSTAAVLDAPTHEYTRRLLANTPRIPHATRVAPAGSARPRENSERA
jgi:peptide/nickel transport system ATP-binding protein